MKYNEKLSKMLFNHCTQRNSNSHTVLELINQGADVNFIEHGNSCLSHICSRFADEGPDEYFDEKLLILKILLENGANANFKVTHESDRSFEFPENGVPCVFWLFNQLSTPHKNVVKAMSYLIKHGANLNVQDSSGATFADKVFYSLMDNKVLFKPVMKLLFEHNVELKVNKTYRTMMLKRAIEQDIPILGLSMIIQEGVDDIQLRIRKIDKKCNGQLSTVTLGDFYNHAKQDGHLIEKLLFCIHSHDNPKEVIEFIKNRCDPAFMFFPRRYHTRPQEKKGVLTFLQCLHAREFQVPQPIIFKILNENVSDDSAEKIIEDILEEFNASASNLKL